MRILVCIKQVPGTANVLVDEKTGVLLRNGVASKMNPYDLFALEAAFRIREQMGGTVTALTMGPPQAGAILREAIAMGADDACLLTDRAFAGADVVATSHTLTQGIGRLGPFDLLIFGRQTTDGDTAQVGAEVAEFLGWPHAANVSAIEAVSSDSIQVKVNLERTVQTLAIALPCLLMVEKDIYMPRLPSYRRQRQIADRQVQTLSLADFADTDMNHYGLAGSPTKVEKIFPPIHESARETLTGPADGIGEALFTLLLSRKFIDA